jgi:hypothetical protein
MDLVQQDLQLVAYFPGVVMDPGKFIIPCLPHIPLAPHISKHIGQLGNLPVGAVKQSIYFFIFFHPGIITTITGRRVFRFLYSQHNSLPSHSTDSPVLLSSMAYNKFVSNNNVLPTWQEALSFAFFRGI